MSQAFPDHATPQFWSSRRFAHVSPTVRGLHALFAIRAEGPAELGTWLQATFAALHEDAPSTAPDVVYSLLDDAATGRHALYGNDRLLHVTRTRSRTVQLLLWNVNRLVVRSSQRLLLLHAAAAERDGVRIILPAAGESGKTTTVAGLMTRGWTYLTDEVAGLTLDGELRLEPFRKALAVDKGSWPLLPTLQPRDMPVLSQWQVAPPTVTDYTPAPPDLVVSPRYDQHARTRLVEVGRADAVVLLAQSTFGFFDDARRLLPPVADLARRTRTFVLHLSDLDEGLNLIDGLLDSVRGLQPVRRTG